MTWCAWIKTTAGGNRYVYSNYESGTDRVEWRINNGRIRLLLNDEGKVTYRDSSATVNDGQWHFIASVWKSDESPPAINHYVDGQLLNQPSYGGRQITDANIQPRSSWDFIGCRGNSNNWFNGHIDDVRIYNFNLSDGQILDLYNSSEQGEVLQAMEGTKMLKLSGEVSNLIEFSNQYVRLTMNTCDYKIQPEDYLSYWVCIPASSYCTGFGVDLKLHDGRWLSQIGGLTDLNGQNPPRPSLPKHNGWNKVSINLSNLRDYRVQKIAVMFDNAGSVRINGGFEAYFDAVRVGRRSLRIENTLPAVSRVRINGGNTGNWTRTTRPDLSVTPDGSWVDSDTDPNRDGGTGESRARDKLTSAQNAVAELSHFDILWQVKPQESRYHRPVGQWRTA